MTSDRRRGRGAGKEDGEAESSSPVCELCGGPTKEVHCKIICLNCGFKRDCSDP